MAKVEVIGDELVYSKYLSLYDRKVKVTKPNGEESILHYDVAGHPKCAFQFSVAFPFHPATRTAPPQVTLVQEWAQGLDCMVFTLPTGGFDPAKHASLLECAVAELSEEALLRGGEAVRLLPEGHKGIAEVKWCRNRFIPYLFIDPQPDPSPGSRDAEEHSLQMMRVGVDELLDIMASGDMMLPSITTCHLALAELARRGLLAHPYYLPQPHAAAGAAGAAGAAPMPAPGQSAQAPAAPHADGHWPAAVPAEQLRPSGPSQDAPPDEEDRVPQDRVDSAASAQPRLATVELLR